MSPNTEKVKIAFVHHLLDSSPNTVINPDDEVEENDVASRLEWFNDEED